MRELHQRLTALAFHSSADALDDYGDGTVAVVEAFQRSRGLPITGEVDAITWSRLIEAGWHLGERLLYLAHPNLRGDDIAELQMRLAQLGFNPGRIDGIFGPLLHETLGDFQRNCALEVTGVMNRATLADLLRVTSTTLAMSPVTEARDRAGFNDIPSGPLVICGRSPIMGPLVRAIGDSTDVSVITHERVELIATVANEDKACLVLSLQSVSRVDGIHLHYWASYRSHSRQGERLASAIAAACTRSQGLPRVEVTGMALPILRETRMTTLHITHGSVSPEEIIALAEVIAKEVKKVIHRNETAADC